MNNFRQNLFGPGRTQQGYGQAPATPPRDNQAGGGYGGDPRRGYGDPRDGYGAPPQPPRSQMPVRPPVGRNQPAHRVQLRIAKVEDKTLANLYIFGNM